LRLLFVENKRLVLLQLLHTALFIPKEYSNKIPAEIVVGSLAAYGDCTLVRPASTTELLVMLFIPKEYSNKIPAEIVTPLKSSSCGRV
jgi:hypothetical protein